MTDKSLQLILLIVGGIIVADFVANPKGTTAFFSGLRKMFQIFVDPTNTKGL